VGGEKRSERPADGGGTHPKGRNKVKDPERSDGLRSAAVGLEGSGAYPAPLGKAQRTLIAPGATPAGACKSVRCARRRYRRAESALAGSVHEHTARGSYTCGRPIAAFDVDDFAIQIEEDNNGKGCSPRGGLRF